MAIRIAGRRVIGSSFEKKNKTPGLGTDLKTVLWAFSGLIEAIVQIECCHLGSIAEPYAIMVLA
jgi:hypothetical protein